jgi:hypothetical protein
MRRLSYYNKAMLSNGMIWVIKIYVQRAVKNSFCLVK